MTAQQKQDGMDTGLARWVFGWIAGGGGWAGMAFLGDSIWAIGCALIWVVGGFYWWWGLGGFLYYLCCPVEQVPAQMVPPAYITPPPLPSVADQLIKLAELQRVGLLTVEEFEAQKKSLLSPS